MKIYETERLILKVLGENYSKEVVEYISYNKEFFSGEEPIREKKFYTEEYQSNELKKDLGFIENGSMLRLWVYEKFNLNRIVGQVTFYNIVPFAFFSCHLGYKSHKDNINKGIITEAVRKGIDIMFNEYGMHRIEAYTLIGNEASQRVLQKLGFIDEGIAHEFLEIGGVWRNHKRFALINNTKAIDKLD